MRRFALLMSVIAELGMLACPAPIAGPSEGEGEGEGDEGEGEGEGDGGEGEGDAGEGEGEGEGEGDAGEGEGEGEGDIVGCDGNPGAANQSCICNVGDDCGALECVNPSGCDFVCLDQSQCDPLDCNTVGNCTLLVETGGDSADLGCAAGGCDFICNGSGDCDMGCQGGGCTLTCSADAQDCVIDACSQNCVVNCNGAQGTCEIVGCDASNGCVVN